MNFLGLDIGTGACKGVVFTDEGREIASGSREYTILHPEENRAELDPGEVISQCFEVIRELNNTVTDPVRAMAVSSQGEAFIPVDDKGNALYRVMVSSDSRAGRISSSWSEEFGIDRLYSITGHTPHPLFTLFKVLWLQDHEPEVWERSRYLLCFEDLFHFRLGLEPRISWSMAGRTMMFDVVNHEWSSEILDAAGIDISRLSVPVASGEVVGTVPGEIASSLGFKHPVLVVTGGHDQTCAALGAGVTDPGMCMYATGTVECFCPILEKPHFTEALKQNNLCCYDFTIKNKYTSVAYSLTGGSILRWMRDQLGQMEMETAVRKGRDAYELLLNEMPGPPTGLHVLPYFSASGTPYFDAEAYGAIIGLRDTTTKGEITKALLEGVCLEMKLNLRLMEEAGIKVSTIIATGGGTRNRTWLQLKADVLNREILVTANIEAGCYGAAMLAKSAFDGIAVERIIKDNAKEMKRYLPVEEKAGVYKDKYLKYRELYPMLKNFREIGKNR